MWKKLFHGHYLKISYVRKYGRLIIQIMLRDFCDQSGKEFYKDNVELQGHEEAIELLNSLLPSNSEAAAEVDQAKDNIEELYIYEEVSPLYVDFYPESELLYSGRYFRIVKSIDRKT